MSVRIEVPKEIWPYGPATSLLENDIRDLLKEIPGLRYGMIEGLYPCVYWDTPLARFAVMPKFIPTELFGFPPKGYNRYYDVKPVAVVVFDAYLYDKRTRIFGLPCLVPELGRWISVPMDAIVEITMERIYIKPERVTFRTDFYGGVYSIYSMTKELLAGEAERQAEKNVVWCFHLPSYYLGKHYAEAITRHIAGTTLIPEERIVEIMVEIRPGICNSYFSKEFQKMLEKDTDLLLSYQTILMDDKGYLQRYLIGEFIRSNIITYREYISMKDLCEGGANKIYEGTIKGSIIDRIPPRLAEWFNPYPVVYRKYDEMLLPYLKDTRPFEVWQLVAITEVGHPFREKVKEFAESAVREILEKVLMIKDKQAIEDVSRDVREAYMVKLDEDLDLLLREQPKFKFDPDKLKEFFAGMLGDMMKDAVRYDIRDLCVGRILTELYDKPIHVLSDVYVSMGDYLAFVLHDTLQEFIDRYLYNAWEAVRSRFGVRGVEIKPQRLYSRR
jgi:hypothetical protein